MKKVFMLMAVIVLLGLGGIAQAGQVAHYTFQEGSGTVTADVSGSGNDAAIIAVPASPSPWVDGKLIFDNSGDYLDMGKTTSQLGIDETGGFTRNMSFTAWVRFNDTAPPVSGTNYHLFSNLDWNTSGQTLRIEGNGTTFNLKYIVCDEPWGPGNGGYYQKSVTNIYLSNDTTYHIGFIRNGGNIKIFVDGVLMADENLMLPKSNSLPLYISNPSQSFAGQLMDVQIYNTALTDEEVISQSEIAPPTPGVVAHYTFLEGAGTTTADVSGNGNDAAINGAGWGFNKLSFDGTDDYLDTGTTSDLGISETGGFTRNMSYTAWVYFDTLKPTVDTNYTLFSNLEWNTSGQILRIEGTTFNLKYVCCDEPWGSGNGGYFQKSADTINLSNKTLYHIGFVRNGENIKIFVDGVKMADRGFMLPKANSLPMYVSNASQAFMGSMMDVQFFNKALSEAEIASLAGIPPDMGGLVAHYDFHDGSGTIATDISGKGNDADIYGAAWGLNKLNFDGIGDYLDTGKSMSQLGLTGDMTFAARVHFDPADLSASTNWHLFSNMDWKKSGQWLRIEGMTTHTRLIFGAVTGNGIDNGWYARTGAQYYPPYSPDNDIQLLDDTTYHIGFVRNGGNVKIFVDGVVRYECTSTDFVPTNNSLPLLISTDAQSFAGQMMDVRLYNIPISDAEMAALAAQVPPDTYTLSGTVNLLDFGGDKTTIPVTVELNGTPIALNLDVDGKFTILDVPAGTYDVRIKASHWLAKLTSGVGVLANTVMDIVDLINGDVVDNNEVDFSDINATRAAYGSFPGDETWNELADVDGSGEVDFTDINIVRSKYGEIGD